MLWKYWKTVDNPKCNWIWNENLLVHFNVHMSEVLEIHNTYTEWEVHSPWKAGEMPNFSHFPISTFRSMLGGVSTSVRWMWYTSCQGNHFFLECIVPDPPFPQVGRKGRKKQVFLDIYDWQFDWISCQQVCLNWGAVYLGTTHMQILIYVKPQSGPRHEEDCQHF